MINEYAFKTPIGQLLISENNHKITGTTLLNAGWLTDFERYESGKKSELIYEAYVQLREYFEGKRRSFDLPIDPSGTEFQKKVWSELQKIPYGQTASYGDIAAAIGNPKAARGVGQANGKNPIMIIVPCHRVIGRNGSLTGFAYGVQVKKYLLDLEKRYFETGDKK